MRTLDPERIAAETGAEIVRRGEAGPPQRVRIDSREVGVGDLFFGLRGSSVDGGEFASAALAGGAWGVVVEPGAGGRAGDGGPRLGARRGGPARGAREPWRAPGGASSAPATIGVTGSVGKTSVKDIAASLLPGVGPLQRGELQHRDRPAADACSRRPEGTEVAGARDGDEGGRADRRAGGDRRARGGGDHQRRARSTSSCSGRSRRSRRPRPRCSDFLPADGAAVVPGAGRRAGGPPRTQRRG